MSERHGEQIDFDGFSGYVSRPDGDPKGALIVIHEIWGLVDHIKDVADRFAAQGYLAVAPDILSHGGITPEVGDELQRLRESADEEERTRLQPLMREKMAPVNEPGYGSWAVGALQQVVDWLEPQPGVDGRIGVIGFCFGGSYAFALAANDERIKAAAPFYGAPPQSTDYAGIRCPVRAFYGRNDPRLIDGLPEVERGMKEAGVDFEAKVYEGAGHAFFNDANSHAYDADAAADAWQRVLAFFDEAVAKA
ncbi:dienelactone hydrolase family protein [Gryllotalpicola ginsengisoli]|uniref:dienelactone hydrolase family protein n=1 Tax=Gryllotalpicola ginsengisoli TaxID=444608 RepID=UPI0003B7A558|nr:dienelactone hydrolase family protein [Gryllotalpicola ginsengisoli]